jgi:hypothetical protein
VRFISDFLRRHPSLDLFMQKVMTTSIQHSGVLAIIGIVGTLYGGSNVGGVFSTVFQPIFEVNGRAFLKEKTLDVGMIFIFGRQGRRGVRRTPDASSLPQAPLREPPLQQGAGLRLLVVSGDRTLHDLDPHNRRCSVHHRHGTV